MGIYLSQPNTKKKVVELSNEQISFSSAEMQGWRKNMEDAAIHQIDLGDGNSLFGVLDGHGGGQVSQFVSKEFAALLKVSQNYQNGKYEEAITEVFQKMDELIYSQEGAEVLVEIRKQLKASTEKQCPNHRIAEETGCTANIILITKQQIWVANSGDSRSVLCRGGVAIALSEDHKPQSPQQEKRVIKAGGKVEEGRVNGSLSLTRAFGDFKHKMNEALSYKEQAITCHPEIKSIKRTKEDEFIICGCDGIWERFIDDNQAMVDLLKQEVQSRAYLEEITEDLLNELIARDTKTGIGCDNMTAIVIKFHHQL